MLSQLHCCPSPAGLAETGHLRGPAGEHCGEAVDSLLTLFFSGWVSNSAQGAFKEEEKLCLSLCNRKLFYHLNVVKLLFNKNCQSWTSQSGVPGDRAGAEDKVIPGKLFHQLGLHWSAVCQTLDGTDTWWLVGVGHEK